MAELNCTCRPGEGVAGTRQEIIEQRLAPLFGLTVPEVHVLLDLMDRTLDVVLDIPDEDRSKERDELVQMMAAESGRTVGWVTNFLDSWEFTSDEVSRETHVPLPKFGTDPRFAERK